MILFIQLFLAHILGDFVFQTNSWVKSKQTRKLKSPHLYFHILLHGTLAMLIVYDIDFWLPALLLMGSHFIIDLIRLYLPLEKNQPIFFIFDQMIHLLVLAGITFWWMDAKLSMAFLQSIHLLILFTGIVFVSVPASIIIRILISQLYNAANTGNDDSLQNAGSYIGILERLFVLIFVLGGHWQGIGFLIAAKSIFRFADIKGNPDRKLTEYFLIGTLLSIGLSMVTGLIMKYLLTIDFHI
jgi:hypothetical protein